MNQIQPRAHPFLFRGNDTGCLLLHGLPGSPYEVREMGEFLAEKGFSVCGPRLFGHGTHHDDLKRAKWWDWFNSAMDGYYQLSDICSRIFLVGLSMGGAISLLLGSRLAVDGVFVMAVPFTIPIKHANRIRPFLPIISQFWRYYDSGSSDWTDKEAERTHSAYDRRPLRIYGELYDLLGVMREELPNLSAPLRLIYSEDDGSIPTSDAQEILDAVASPDKEVFLIDGSGHNIPRDAKRDEVFHLASRFVDKVIST